jgi:GTPase Era involved in 16S rRNA processing
MKLEKFNELNRNMSKFFDACDFIVHPHNNFSETELIVYDNVNKKTLVKINFINTIDVNSSNRMSLTKNKDRNDVLEFNLTCSSFKYDVSTINIAELSAIKRLIMVYREA